MSKSLGSMYITYYVYIYVSPIDIETKNHHKKTVISQMSYVWVNYYCIYNED